MEHVYSCSELRTRFANVATYTTILYHMKRLRYNKIMNMVCNQIRQNWVFWIELSFCSLIKFIMDLWYLLLLLLLISELFPVRSFLNIMDIKYLCYCLFSVIALLTIILTEPLYGTYTDSMWVETMTFIPNIQAGSTKAGQEAWHLYSDVGLLLVQAAPILYFLLIPT